MEYLTQDDKRNILIEKLQSSASQMYQLDMSLQIAQANNNQEAVAQCQAMLNDFAVSIKVYQDELAKLETE